ncbi:hypothetical protein [Lactobacillus delbrueckii]|uniref:hypothetical protein n=1 Tax=Lactobacillus delbrueckii TaxID=1584 RepID=UPI000202EBCC|nr:hypothetical protein [Lactobacillus delbrueckii]EGD27672.1 hypothetical protein HMPREF5505_0678 [Lactobacillus delbrueckii subsp. lactis DSM 20072]
MDARAKNQLSANPRQDRLRRRAEETNKYEQLKRLPADRQADQEEPKLPGQPQTGAKE